MIGFKSFLPLGSALILSGASACLLVVNDDCGTHAFHHRHACYCEDGFVGDPYDRCEPAIAVMTFELIDGCNDNLAISWRLVTAIGTWQWPETGTYTTLQLGQLTSQDIECQIGESICFGAAAGDKIWGCGLDQPTCESKCFACEDVTIDLGTLECL